MKQFDVTVSVETHILYRIKAETKDEATRQALDKARRGHTGLDDDVQAADVWDVDDTTDEM